MSKTRISPIDVYKLLPRTNCKECGHVHKYREDHCVKCGSKDIFLTSDRPGNLAWAKRWCADNLNTFYYRKLEADDLLDIYMTDNAILWSLDRDTPYTPSPLLYEETLYFLKSNSSILSCFNARTGEEYYRQQRLEGIGTVYSSPVGAAGRVYITDREGNTLVIRHGPQFEVLASNSLDDGFDASPAIVDDHIYLRGQQNLYCIAEED